MSFSTILGEGSRRPYIALDIKKQVVQDFVRRLGRPPTADELIEEARDPDHPLHNAFDFSDIEGAAMNHWRDIARRIISEVRIIVETSTRTIVAPVYVEAPNKVGKEQGYIEVRGAAKNRDNREALLQRSIEEVRIIYERGLGVCAQLGLEKRYVNAIRKLIE